MRVPVAQPGLEQRFPKPKAAGSNPAGDTKTQGGDMQPPDPERLARTRGVFPIDPRTPVYPVEFEFVCPKEDSMAFIPHAG